MNNQERRDGMVNARASGWNFVVRNAAGRQAMAAVQDMAGNPMNLNTVHRLGNAADNGGNPLVRWDPENGDILYDRGNVVGEVLSVPNTQGWTWAKALSQELAYHCTVLREPANRRTNRQYVTVTGPGSGNRHSEEFVYRVSHVDLGPGRDLSGFVKYSRGTK